ncbi:MAG: galactokinase [Phycisphaeraceae bacterium]
MPQDDCAPSADLAKRFEAMTGKRPEVIASAPGRIEVLGNHTDYNAGLTLSCAVPMRCAVALGPSDGPFDWLASTAFPGEPVRVLDRTSPPTDARWTHYVLGLIDGLERRGVVVPRIRLLIDSGVPAGAGVSSSAAFEVAVLTALCESVSAELSPVEMARLCQYAEASHVGAKTGLLDPLSSLLGRVDSLLQIDFASMQTRAVPMPEGMSFLAIDSGVKHDLTGDYNVRREACESAARAMGVATLREATRAGLDDVAADLTDLERGCALHVIDEIARVSQANDALERGAIERFGELMFASHESSRTHFRNSCDELDAVIELAKGDPRCLGARLSGGGFGGIAIALVKAAEAEALRSQLIATLGPTASGQRWSAVCDPSAGACVHR